MIKMAAAVKVLKKEIIEKLDELPKKDIKELYDYVIFLEMKQFIPQIDPSQAYFWTRKWQKMERAVEEDKKAGRIIGTGKVKDLLKALKYAN